MSTDSQTASTDAFAHKAVEAAVRIALVALLLGWCWQITRPFVTPVAWGIILTIALYPAYRWLAVLVGERRRLAAALTAAALLVLLVGPIGMLAPALLDNLQTLATDLSAGTLRVPPPPAAVADWPLIGEPLHRLWAMASTNLEAALRQIEPQLQALGGWLLGFVATVGLGVLQFLLAIVIAGVLLQHADGAKQAAHGFARRVAGARGASFVDLAGATVRNVARGVLGTALIQSTLAGIGLVVAGVPGAGLIAFLAFLLSAVQIGAGLVLLPTMVYVFATADLLTAVLFAVWTAPVMLVDNVLKPVLMSRGVDVPMLVIFAGVVGGTLASGIVGLFIGPVVLAVGYRLISAWVDNGTARDAPTPAA